MSCYVRIYAVLLTSQDCIAYCYSGGERCNPYTTQAYLPRYLTDAKIREVR